MTPRIVKLIAEIDEFKGYWGGMENLSSKTLSSMQILATIESIGSSTRIEGAKLSNRQVAALLDGLDLNSFSSRDEQEVAGYARGMQLIHDSFEEIDLTENNIKYLHKVVMQFSAKDSWHLGEYKKHPNHVAAFDSDGNQIGIIFETATPLDTPWLMENLVQDSGGRLSRSKSPSSTDDCRFRGPFSGNSSISGWQWTSLPSFDKPAAASKRLCVRSVQFPRKDC